MAVKERDDVFCPHVKGLVSKAALLGVGTPAGFYLHFFFKQPVGQHKSLLLLGVYHSRGFGGSDIFTSWLFAIKYTEKFLAIAF